MNNPYVIRPFNQIGKRAEFYCIHCAQTHPKTDSDDIFKTGFRSFPTGETYPLGICKKSETVSQQSQKAEDCIA
ncbi:DUF3973 domain-containing protein [Effusibacillus lacus]|uniref:DUF3973 domain-containing protein n=1 Tax=Effusibacillus lacus TaxID=1348429 RepID=A0A292YQ64_9BACL|nr:hypothetical protein [Effusibacillus lacus]